MKELIIAVGVVIVLGYVLLNLEHMGVIQYNMYNGMILSRDGKTLTVYRFGAMAEYDVTEKVKPEQEIYTTVKCGFCEFPIRIDKSILRERDNYVLCSDCRDQHSS